MYIQTSHLKRLIILSISLILISCGGGGGGNTNNGSSGNDNSGVTSGVITLLGDDTSIVGTQLNTGNVGISPAAGDQPDYIVIVDKASSVTFTPPNILIPNVADPANGLVLVVTDASAISGFKGISMSISVGGNKLDYACSLPSSAFTICGGIDSIILDLPNKSVTFNNALVQNVDTKTTMTLNGTLTWGQGSPNTGGNTGGNIGQDIDLVGSWAVCFNQNPSALQNLYTFNSDTTYKRVITQYSGSECDPLAITSSSSFFGNYGTGQTVTISSGNTATQIEGMINKISVLGLGEVDLVPADVYRGLYLLDSSKTLLNIILNKSLNNDPEYPTDLSLSSPLTKL